MELGAFVVVSDDYVTTDSGTGLVHKPQLSVKTTIGY